MNIKRLFIFFLLLTTAIGLQGQNRISISSKTYAIGDTLPDYSISNLINYRINTAKLSDFKGKILILDYWATWCGSCVAMFPKEEELQKEFGDKIQFLLVTKEDSKTVSTFLSRSKKYKNTTYPHLLITTGDSLLHSLINHYGYPYYAWIDRSGVLRNITDEDFVNEQSIHDILNGHVRIEKQNVSMGLGKPIFVNGNGGDGSQIQTYSVLAKYVENVDTHTGGEMRNHINKIYLINVPLKAIYQYAFFYDYQDRDSSLKNFDLFKAHPGLFEVANNRTILELKDTSEVVGYVNDTINKKACYTYQLLIPNADFPVLRKYMQEDLERYFPYYVHLEKRQLNCLVLSSADTSLLISKGGKPLIKQDGYTISFKDIPFMRLSYALNHQYASLPPFIDETGFKGRTDLVFTANMKDWKSIAEALKKYKLNLKLEERDIDLLVISDVPSKTF